MPNPRSLIDNVYRGIRELAVTPDDLARNDLPDPDLWRGLPEEGVDVAVDPDNFLHDFDPRRIDLDSDYIPNHTVPVTPSPTQQIQSAALQEQRPFVRQGDSIVTNIQQDLDNDVELLADLERRIHYIQENAPNSANLPRMMEHAENLYRKNDLRQRRLQQFEVHPSYISDQAKQYFYGQNRGGQGGWRRPGPDDTGAVHPASIVKDEQGKSKVLGWTNTDQISVLPEQPTSISQLAHNYEKNVIDDVYIVSHTKQGNINALSNMPHYATQNQTGQIEATLDKTGKYSNMYGRLLSVDGEFGDYGFLAQAQNNAAHRVLSDKNAIKTFNSDIADRQRQIDVFSDMLRQTKNPAEKDELQQIIKNHKETIDNLKGRITKTKKDISEYDPTIQDRGLQNVVRGSIKRSLDMGHSRFRWPTGDAVRTDPDTMALSISKAHDMYDRDIPKHVFKFLEDSRIANKQEISKLKEQIAKQKVDDQGFKMPEKPEKPNQYEGFHIPPKKKYSDEEFAKRMEEYHRAKKRYEIHKRMFDRQFKEAPDDQILRLTKDEYTGDYMYELNLDGRVKQSAIEKGFPLAGAAPAAGINYAQTDEKRTNPQTDGQGAKAQNPALAQKIEAANQRSQAGLETLSNINWQFEQPPLPEHQFSAGQGWNPYESLGDTSAAWAYGTRNMPGEWAGMFDMAADYTTPGYLADVFYPTDNSLRKMVEPYTQVNEMGFKPETPLEHIVSFIGEINAEAGVGTAASLMRQGGKQVGKIVDEVIAQLDEMADLNRKIARSEDGKYIPENLPENIERRDALKTTGGIAGLATLGTVGGLGTFKALTKGVKATAKEKPVRIKDFHEWAEEDFYPKNKEGRAIDSITRDGQTYPRWKLNSTDISKTYEFDSATVSRYDQYVRGFDKELTPLPEVDKLIEKVDSLTFEKDRLKIRRDFHEKIGGPYGRMNQDLELRPFDIVDGKMVREPLDVTKAKIEKAKQDLLKYKPKDMLDEDYFNALDAKMKVREAKWNHKNSMEITESEYDSDAVENIADRKWNDLEEEFKMEMEWDRFDEDIAEQYYKQPKASIDAPEVLAEIKPELSALKIYQNIAQKGIKPPRMKDIEIQRTKLQKGKSKLKPEDRQFIQEVTGRSPEELPYDEVLELLMK